MVDDYNFSIDNSSDESDDDQYCIPMNAAEPLSTKKSKPIPINRSTGSSSESEGDIQNDSYISPMFNTPLIFTPNNNNGYIFVQPENGGTIGDNFNTERSISESLMDYMNQTVNYFRSYYYS